MKIYHVSKLYSQVIGQIYHKYENIYNSILKLERALARGR